MLDNIKIQNYRNIKSLSIEKLGGVNLIIGRNNTGKTSLLEAMYILLMRGSSSAFDHILESRQEKNPEPKEIKKKLEELSSLFYGRNLIFSDSEKIYLTSTSGEIEYEFSIRFVNYFEKIINLKSSDTPKGLSNIISSFYKEKEECDATHPGSKIGLKITRNGVSNIKSFDEVNLNDLVFEEYISSHQNIICIFIPSSGYINVADIGKWWSNVALTEIENTIIDSLKIIEPKIEKISQVQSEYSSDHFLIKLKEKQRPIPLRSMGDGINRILTIVLAMVNCKNGYILIDEFENGLHYSVQEKLWEIIFYLSDWLNIQVFATTHSNDTIRAFENIVNQNEITPLDGLLIKLENINDIIQPTTFEPNELKVITDNLIEVRR